MAEARKFTAKINAKGLDNTGVTEDHARAMAATLGSHTLLIVEVNHATKTVDEEGNEQVRLVVGMCEPVPAEQEDTVREFMRALYRQRPEQMGQAVLTGADQGPSVDDAAAQMAAAVEKDDNGVVTGLWDGNPDTPLTAVPDAPENGYCPFAGCDLEDEHDGDHNVPTEDEDAEETAGG